MDILFLENDMDKVNSRSLIDSFFEIANELNLEMRRGEFCKGKVNEYFEFQIGTFTDNSEDLSIRIPKKPGGSVFERLVKNTQTDVFDITEKENIDYIRVAIGKSDNISLIDEFLLHFFKLNPNKLISIDGVLKWTYSKADYENLNRDNGILNSIERK